MLEQLRLVINLCSGLITSCSFESGVMEQGDIWNMQDQDGEPLLYVLEAIKLSLSKSYVSFIYRNQG